MTIFLGLVCIVLFWVGLTWCSTLLVVFLLGPGRGELALFTDHLQRLAVPIEYLGFTITAVEILRPATADAIEESLTIMRSAIERLSGGRFLLLCFTPALMFAAWLWIQRDIRAAAVILGALTVPTLIAYSLVAATLDGVAQTLARLDRISPGRALGALGLCLAGIGVALESVQFAALLWPESAGVAYDYLRTATEGWARLSHWIFESLS